MEATEEKSVRIYACLNALKGENSDVLAPLTYFFEEYFFISHGKIFSQASLVTFARTALGWNITDEIAEDFVPLFEKMGWIEARGTDQQAVYIVNHERAASSVPDPTIELVSKLRNALSIFMRVSAAEVVAGVSDDDLLDRFLKWLMNLKDADNAGQNTLEENSIDEVSSAELDVSSLDYFFARFVEETVETDPVLASSIPNLWAVGMLLEVADEITKPAALSQKSDLKIVIDAPVALNYLGLSGRKSQQGIVLVLDSLRAIGCKIAVYDISCQEINHALSSLLKNLPPDRYGRTADALRAKEVTVDRVEYVRDHPDTALAAANVEILPYKLESTKALEKHFSYEMYEDYLNSIGWGDTIHAKIHDATVFALTMRLRHGYHSSDFFRNKLVFITQNPTFFRSSRIYALRSQVLNEHHIPPVFSTKRLATIAWLQTGLNVANTEIPKGILVNVCARITSTKRSVLEQAREDIASLTEEQQAEYRALATHPRSTKVLMDYYESRPQVIDGDNPTELLTRMESALAEEHERRAAEAVAGVKAEAANQLGRVQAEVAALSSQAQEQRTRADALTARIYSEAIKTANLAALLTRVLVVAFFVLATVATLFLPAETPDWLRIFLIILGAVLAAASTYFTFFRASGPILNHLIGDFWAKRATKSLRRRGIESTAVAITADPTGRISLTELKLHA